MIQDAAYWREWEAGQARREGADYARNAAIFARLMAEARALGHWPPRDPLAGLEEKIQWLGGLIGRTDSQPASPVQPSRRRPRP